MIEQTLQNAADKLPESRSDFWAVEEKVKEKKNRSRSLPRRRFAVAMVLCILLVGCVAISEPDYHLYNGTLHGYTPAEDTHREADKLGITLPETLGGYPVIGFSRYNLTNQDVPYWYALLAPRYVYYSSFYGVDMEEPWVSPEGIEGTHHWSEGADVTYGSTDDEIWRRQFGFDEDNTFVAANWTLANHPVEEITSFEYEGFTVYVAKIGITFKEKPMWDVSWVDEANGVVFSVQEYYESPDTLIEYAKQIIDLNK